MRNEPDPGGSIVRDRHHLLVAEDDVEMRRLIVEELRREGYLVEEAADGHELRGYVCVASLRPRELWPHLIVSDVRMPGWTGLELLASLRQQGMAIPVVLITAFGDHDTHERAARLGAVTVLDKPFECEELLRAVQHALLHADQRRVG